MTGKTAGLRAGPRPSLGRDRDYTGRLYRTGGWTALAVIPHRSELLGCARLRAATLLRAHLGTSAPIATGVVFGRNAHVWAFTPDPRTRWRAAFTPPGGPMRFVRETVVPPTHQPHPL